VVGGENGCDGARSLVIFICYLYTTKAEPLEATNLMWHHKIMDKCSYKNKLLINLSIVNDLAKQNSIFIRNIQDL
jgi:hypothetical protein